MKFTKQQITAVMILNVVLLILITGVVILFMTGNLQSASSETTPHNPMREARLSASTAFSWENNLGGSNAEELKGFYIVGDRLFVFGNTASNDLDFKENKSTDKIGFLAILSDAGKTLSYTLLSGEIVKTMPLGNKFVVGVNDTAAKKAAVLLINVDAQVERQESIVSTGEEEFIDLKLFSGKIHAVSSVLDKNINVKKLRVSMFTTELAPISTLILSRTFSLKYITILPYDDSFLLAANVESSISNYLTLAQYTVNGNILYTNIPFNESYKTLDFAPFKTGYLALITYKDGTDIIEITKNLQKKSLFYLNEQKANSGRIILNGTSMDVYLNRSADSSVFHSYSLDLESRTTFAEFGNLDSLFYFYLTGKTSLFAASTATSLTIISKSAENALVKSVGNGQEEYAVLIPHKTGALVATAATKSKDFNFNYGKTDIVIFFIPNVL